MLLRVVVRYAIDARQAAGWIVIRDFRLEAAEATKRVDRKQMAVGEP
jgi:hypothetical protein